MRNTIPDIIIAIDGYSSTGKSTFAKLVAREFGFLYLDSGAMYRGVTLRAIESGFVREDNSLDEDAIIADLPALDLHFERGEGKTLLYMGARCIEEEIRTMKVSGLVSPVSAVAKVRAWVDAKLRSFSEGGRVIMDGRDIGTTVFPGAELKIFMTADPDVRARRRYDELLSKGQAPVLEEVKKNLQDRDYMDSHRETSPLRRPEDSFLLDNTHMTMHEELVWILGLIQGRFSLLDPPELSC